MGEELLFGLCKHSLMKSVSSMTSCRAALHLGTGNFWYMAKSLQCAAAFAQSENSAVLSVEITVKSLNGLTSI